MGNEHGDALLFEILKTAMYNNSSDIHITSDLPVMYRVDGKLEPIENRVMSKADVADIISEMLSEELQKELDEMGETDFSYEKEGFSRIRANAFKEQDTYAVALRVLASSIPEPEALSLPSSIIDFTKKKRGLVLVTGATGSGKSTTLASLIKRIADTTQKSIITIEDPIEYVHKSNRSLIVQREIGRDTKSYANALRAALRQDPDVILVGEMRDLDTISTAITAAETGHLVFSTLHTNSAAAAIDRMIDVFPPHQQQQIRTQLAEVIEGVVAQQLLPMTPNVGRAGAFEVLVANGAIRNMIREGKTFQIKSSMQTGKKEGMITMDDAICNLYTSNKISKETALEYAHDKEIMQQQLLF